MLVAAILELDHFYFEGMALVEDAVVKYEAGVLAIIDGVFYRGPGSGRGHPVIQQIAIDRIVREVLVVVGHIGLRVVRLSGQNKLAIISASRLHIGTQGL